MRRFETQEAARKMETEVLERESTSLGYDDIMRQNMLKKKKKRERERHAENQMLDDPKHRKEKSGRRLGLGGKTMN